MLGGFGGFHLCVTQLLAQEHTPYHHSIVFCIVGSPEKKVKGLVPHCHFPSPSCTSSSENCSLASSAFLLQAGQLQMLMQHSSGACPPGSTTPYRVQLLHILSASNATNLAFHLGEHLQRSSWWHPPVSSGEARGSSESRGVPAAFWL